MYNGNKSYDKIISQSRLFIKTIHTYVSIDQITNNFRSRFSKTLIKSRVKLNRTMCLRKRHRKKRHRNKRHRKKRHHKKRHRKKRHH